MVLVCACGGGSGSTSVQPPPGSNPTNPCLAQGSRALTPVPNGTVCGTDQVCQTGACVACADGAPCVPDTTACHKGRLSCGTTPACVDTGAIADDGTVCGVDEVCSGTSGCIGCVEGEICQTGGACYYQSRLSCAQGPICLNQLGNFPDGSTCVDRHGNQGTCESGQCLP
jgi:hypothetical protein